MLLVLVLFITELGRTVLAVLLAALLFSVSTLLLLVADLVTAPSPVVALLTPELELVLLEL